MERKVDDVPEPITDLTPADKVVTRLILDLQLVQYARKYQPRKRKLAASVERDAFKFLVDYLLTGKRPPIRL